VSAIQPELSLYITIGFSLGMDIPDVLRLLSSNCNQAASRAASKLVMYSACVVDVTTVDCFLLLQQIDAPPIKKVYPPVDLALVMSPA
jgi:hypothetical protein